MSPSASLIGLPTFRDSRRASSSKWSRTCWPRSHSRRPRLLGSRPCHAFDSNAVRAAATAASTSSRVPAGTRAMGRFVAGSRTSRSAPEDAGRFEPPMCIAASGTAIATPPDHRVPLISRSRPGDGPIPDVLRVTRTLPWREAAKESFELRPMLLDQFRHEDLRRKHVLDVGTGEGRLAFVAANLGARVIGVDLDHMKLMHARSYAGVRDLRHAQFVWGDVEKDAYSTWSPVPFDLVVSNLCMSPAIVYRSAHALRPGGKMILCCHHADHWRAGGAR